MTRLAQYVESITKLGPGRLPDLHNVVCSFAEACRQIELRSDDVAFDIDSLGSVYATFSILLAG